jgi:hypothetical protein
MLATVEQARGLPFAAWSGERIPEMVREAVRRERLDELDGTYGHPDVGDPIQYDQLRLTLRDRLVEIEVFNRAIFLFSTEDETLKRIHRVLCQLEDLMHRTSGRALSTSGQPLPKHRG